MAIKASSQVSLLDITDAYSVTLTSETFTFVGNTTGAPSGLSCTTQVVAYCGSTKCSKVTIGTVSCPTGISATISNNNTESPTITFKTTATITAACEATIPVTVDGVTINKKFSFSIAKTGSTGATGATGPQGLPGIDFSQGKMLNTDPMFTTICNLTLYNNLVNGNVTLIRTMKSSDNPMPSTDYEIVISNTGKASPGLGGFTFLTLSRANAIFIYRIVAKIPTGYYIDFATNDYGKNGKLQWLTSKSGTGKFTEYIFRLECGDTGSFSTTGFFYIAGGSNGTSSSPVKWYVAYATCFDMTNARDIDSKISKGDVINQVNSELKVEGNSIALTTGHFTINSKNFTLDASGNATFSGTITGAAGEFTKSFYVNVPHPISTYDNDDSAWRISCNDTSMFLGLYIPNDLLDDPPFDNSMANIEISPGSMSIYGNSLFLYSDVGSINMDYVGNGFTINSNFGTKIELSSRINVTGDMNCSGTINASTLQQGGKNISSLYAAKSHSHSYLPLSGGTMTGELTMSNGKYIVGKNKGGDALLLIGINSSNNVHIGSNSKSHSTYIHGGDGSKVYTINFNANRFGPGTDNNVTLGYKAHRWKQLIAGTTTISTSDKNLKENIEPLSDKYVDMLLRLTPVSFRFKDGDSGRTHVGFISQDVEQIMSELGLSALDFAGFCKDQKIDEILDDNGDLKEEIPYVDENGEPVYIYSLRYEEFIAINTCMIQKLYKRVEELEAKLSNL